LACQKARVEARSKDEGALNAQQSTQAAAAGHFMEHTVVLPYTG
jgi:hypothetical protein